MPFVVRLVVEGAQHRAARDQRGFLAAGARDQRVIVPGVAVDDAPARDVEHAVEAGGEAPDVHAAVEQPVRAARAVGGRDAGQRLAADGGLQIRHQHRGGMPLPLTSATHSAMRPWSMGMKS
jgi:hypothetical protein